MSTEIVAERILSAADGAGPDRAARLVFQAFVALSRTADSHQMFPLVARVQKARDASRSARTELIYCTLVGIVATRARLADGPEYLDTVVRIFDENAFGDDPVLVECALTAVMTLMRPHEARRFAPLVDALDLAPVDRARMLAMIGVGDAWAGNLVRGAGLLAAVDDPPLSWPGGPALPAWRAWILAPDSPATTDALAASLGELTRPAEQLLTARIAWLLGAHHGRSGRRGEAARLLEQACAGYARTGAAGMLALVLNDLRLLGGSPTTTPSAVGPARADGPPALDAVPRFANRTGQPSLTGAEARVAAVIADGLSNREAAQRLFLSVKTIEFHLGNIFRKLGVRNRTELATSRARTD